MSMSQTEYRSELKLSGSTKSDVVRLVFLRNVCVRMEMKSKQDE